MRKYPYRMPSYLATLGSLITRCNRIQVFEKEITIFCFTFERNMVYSRQMNSDLLCIKIRE